MKEFERRELLKMRIHHSLRRASTAILLISCTTIILGVIDIEIYHGVKGNMDMPSRPAIMGEGLGFYVKIIPFSFFFVNINFELVNYLNSGPITEFKT